MLDILVFIPSFEDRELLEGCIASVARQMPARYIILDDSVSDKIKEYVTEIGHVIGDKKVSYLPRLQKGRGSHISNWNRAVMSDLETGKSIINFRHHDDYMFDNNMNRLQWLIKAENPSLIITPVRRVLAQSFGLSIDIIHCPSYIQKILVHFFPLKLIYHFNYIGPTACVFINAHSFPSVPLFDERLEWLVDCDWYYRLLRVTAFDRIAFLDSTENISVENRRSITKGLGRGVRDISIRELKILKVAEVNLLTVSAAKLVRFAVFLLSLHTLRIRKMHSAKKVP